MTHDCNAHALEAARARVADTMAQPYHKRAVLNGEWDAGSLVQAALQDILRNPPKEESE